ncbi:mandelate racemase/muconate lactonizing enzyme family protein [Citrobacter braakii]|uniref:mandelate racemase/muconate lactonizing enzyme family protein n=1 Tax=Citrobacter braakii TaxID=57706 RepID=UPI000CDE1D92|nr:mandelate racemase/muconate lactonizing enzyme family protein [Citrobacter braakii]POT30920.1 mandelate racemase/muconate lactonizing enzyme family protein [Citrobacter braakii]POT35749.1 mandelate racemase/muconate lactonizing enzyme family protein [Citrobacter braakii]POT40575.1 mandelate racemase/muconate lactonizing enzyme family protein [Citrobacter braakii]POU82117.1 mandelate racemase/muconate lactonizing enzyme family protein [Citrobacter braakii]POV09624.1 mandelate racemase/mucona
MRITNIDSFLVRLPYTPTMTRTTDKEGLFNAARSLNPTLDALLVRVESDSGLTGWGEAFGHACNPASMALLSGLLAPFFTGETCDDTEALMQKAHYAFHSYGRGGAMMYALSALDIALWDLRGKAENLPLWKLLGGTRSQVELYPSLASFDGNVAKLMECINPLIKKGYRHIKLHERDPQAIVEVAQALPDEVTLMVDTNCAWNAQQAEEILPQLHAAGVDFVEEPTFPPENISQLRYLRQMTGARIAAGENFNNSEEFVLSMALDAVDVLQPSVAKIGGISAVLNIIKHARAHKNVSLLPHCFYYGPGLLASAHLLSVLPKPVPLEVPWLMFEQILHPFMHFEPVMELPQAPGLGFNPDIDVLERHLIAKR